MLKYIHVTNDLGSGRKIRPFDWVYSIAGPDRKDQRAPSTHFKKSVYLVRRREVFKSLLKNGAKAGAETQEKKYLINSRATDIILFLTKGIVL